jgi:hypothetical protein
MLRGESPSQLGKSLIGAQNKSAPSEKKNKKGSERGGGGGGGGGGEGSQCVGLTTFICRLS